MMLRKWLSLAAALSIVSASQVALAQASLGLSTIYLQYESSILSRDAGVDPASRYERTIFPLDLHVGYITGKKIYFGLMYHQGFLEEKAGSGSLTTTEYERTAYGPTIGYIADSLRLSLTYYLHAEYKSKVNDTNTRTTYEDGSGFQIDVAYGFKASSNVYVGPNLSYRKFSYKTLTGNNVSFDAKINEAEILPLIATWITL